MRSLRSSIHTPLFVAIPFLMGGICHSVQAEPTAITINDDTETKANNALDAGDTQKAIDLYSQCIRENPESAYPYYNRAIGYIRFEQNEKAMADVNVFIRLMPKETIGYALRSDVYRAMKKYDEALVDINKVGDLDDSKMDYQMRGIIYLRKGENKAAIKDFNESLKRPGDNKDLTYVLLGDAYSSTGQTIDAITAYTKGIALKPEESYGYQQRCNLYLDNKDADLAMPDAQKYIALKPEEPVGYYLRAAVYALKETPENDDLAIKDFEKSLSFEKNGEQRSRVLASIGVIQDRLKDYPSLIATMSTLIQSNPENQEYVANGLFTRGFAYTSLEKYTEAINDFSEYISRFPTGKSFENARYNLGYCYVFGTPSQDDKAIDLLSQILATNPKHIDAYYARLWAYYHKKQYDKMASDGEAIVLYGDPAGDTTVDAYAKLSTAYDKLAAEKGNDRAIAAKALAAIKQYTTLKPTDIDAIIIYEDLALRYGDSEVRIAAFTDCLHKLPESELENYTILLNNRAILYAEKQEWEKAASDFRRALTLDQKNNVASIGLADIYERLTPPDYSKSLELYTQSIQTNPKYIQAYYGRMFTYLHLKQFDKAIADAEVVMKTGVPKPQETTEALVVEAIAYGQMAAGKENDKQLGTKALAAIKRYMLLNPSSTRGGKLQDYLVSVYEKGSIVPPAVATAALTTDQPPAPYSDSLKISRKEIAKVVFGKRAPGKMGVTPTDAGDKKTTGYSFACSASHVSVALPEGTNTTKLDTMILSVTINTDGSATWKVAQGCGEDAIDTAILKAFTSSQWEPAVENGKPFTQELNLIFMPKSLSAGTTTEIDLATQEWLEPFLEAKATERQNPEIPSDIDRTLLKPVKVEFTITASGACVYKIVTSSGSTDADAAVLKACAAYRWQPARRGGKPVQQNQFVIFDLTK